MTQGTTRVLAVASGGGHWEQLMLLRPTLARYDVRFATTDPGVALKHDIADAARLPDWSGTPSPTARRLHDALAAFIEGRPI